MDDQVIFTPFFLDKPYDDLDHLVEPDWIVNRPDLPAGETQEKMLGTTANSHIPADAIIQM